MWENTKEKTVETIEQNCITFYSAVYFLCFLVGLLASWLWDVVIYSSRSEAIYNFFYDLIHGVFKRKTRKIVK